MRKLLKKNKGITLIALVITIIVLLILAGVTINAIMGNESAMEKAKQAKQEHEISTAKDEAVLLATKYIQEYYDKRYVQNLPVATSALPDKNLEVGKDGNSTYKISGVELIKSLAGETVPSTIGEYVANKFRTDATNEGTYNYEAGTYEAGTGSKLTIKSKQTNEKIVTGTIKEDGTIEWDATIDIGKSGLSQEEKTALTANGMRELTGNEITNENLKNNDNIKAVITGQIPIPVGYTYEEGVATSSGVTKPEGKNYGVVLKDSNDNEWVWVPVNSTESVAPSDMYETGTYTIGKKIENDKYKDIEFAKNIKGLKLSEVDDKVNNLNGLKIASINGLNGLKVASSSSSSEGISYTIYYYLDDDYYASESLSADSPFYLGDEWVNENIEKEKSVYEYHDYDFDYVENMDRFISNGDSINVYYKDKTRNKTTTKTSASNILSGIDRDWTDYFREPALVTDYDLQEQYYNEAEFDSAKDMADTFVKDYSDMIESIEKYGGFYVGRYELGGSAENPQVKRGQRPLNDINWYNLYKAERKFGTKNENKDVTISTMIWGCQWDVMCNWIANSGDAKGINAVITDSTSWGNYYNSTFTYIENGQEKTKNQNDNIIIPTGSTEYTRANNLYDVAGNVYEWTQEAHGSAGRASRGGYYDVYGGGGSNYPAGDRLAFFPYSNDSFRSSRPTLYINSK